MISSPYESISTKNSEITFRKYIAYLVILLMASHANAQDYSQDNGFSPFNDSSSIIINSKSIKYTGVNLVSAEYGLKLPGNYGEDYIYPTPKEIDYFVSKGMNNFRLIFRWERLQPDLYGELNGTEIRRIDEVINYANSKGASVTIEPYNFGRYIDKNERAKSGSLNPEWNGKIIGLNLSVSAFADFWTRLALHYKDNRKVVFGLMNEPHDMPTDVWISDANAAIKGIRGVGANNLILVPGNYWTSAHTWFTESYDGKTNAEAMLDISDPINNFAIEVHLYLITDEFNHLSACKGSMPRLQQLKALSKWLKQTGRRGFLAEFASGHDKNCLSLLNYLMNSIYRDKDVWLGWNYWCAGPLLEDDDIYNLAPLNGKDRPQMKILSRYL